MDKNEYLEIVTAQIRCKRAVPYLKKELEDHIQDQKDAYLAQGMNSIEAELAAVNEMGDPVETGVQLDRVHRPKMEWKVLFGAVLLGIIGLIIQMSILKVVSPECQSQELMSHVLALAVGIGMMIIVCYIDYSWLAKYARILWWLLVSLLFLSCICEVPILYRVVNGVNRTSKLIAYFMCPVYSAYVYSWRDQGRKGFLMSLLGLVIFTGLLMCDLPLGWVAKYCMLGFVVFGYALYKNWFQITKSDVKAMIKYGSCVLGGIVISVIYEIINYGYYDFNYVPQYYIERLKIFLSGNATDYIAEEIKCFLQNGGNAIETQFLQGYMQSDYIWLFTTEHFGKAVGLLIAIIFICFAILLIYKTYTQKNQLGKLMSFSCTLFLIIESIFYIGGNLGVIPFLGCFLPFLGDGKVVIIVTYFYTGILLSIFRNTNVVRN